MELIIGFLALLGVGSVAIFTEGGGPYPTKGNYIKRKYVVAFWALLIAFYIGIALYFLLK